MKLLAMAFPSGILGVIIAIGAVVVILVPTIYYLKHLLPSRSSVPTEGGGQRGMWSARNVVIAAFAVLALVYIAWSTGILEGTRRSGRWSALDQGWKADLTLFESAKDHLSITDLAQNTTYQFEGYVGDGATWLQCTDSCCKGLPVTAEYHNLTLVISFQDGQGVRHCWSFTFDEEKIIALVQRSTYVVSEPTA